MIQNSTEIMKICVTSPLKWSIGFTSWLCPKEFTDCWFKVSTDSLLDSHIYIYLFYLFLCSRIYLKRKEEDADLIFLLNADVASLGFSCKKATFFSDARSTPRRLGENLKKGELGSERDCWVEACAQSCFRHLWLRMLTKFAAKVLVFMACFGLKRVRNHGSQQCIRFQKQTLDLKIHSLINRPSLSFVFESEAQQAS